MNPNHAIARIRRILPNVSHSVYCADEKERRRLNALGAKIGPCGRCALEKILSQPISELVNQKPQTKNKE